MKKTGLIIAMLVFKVIMQITQVTLVVQPIVTVIVAQLIVTIIKDKLPSHNLWEG